MKKIQLTEGDLIRLIERWLEGENPTQINARKSLFKKIRSLDIPNANLLSELDALDHKVETVLFITQEQRDFYRSLMKDMKDQYNMYQEKFEIFKDVLSGDVKADKLAHLKRMYPYQKTYKV